MFTNAQDMCQIVCRNPSFEMTYRLSKYL